LVIVVSAKEDSDDKSMEDWAEDAGVVLGRLLRVGWRFGRRLLKGVKRGLEEE